MMYADDIQLYITCDDAKVLTGMIVKCVGEVRHWMRTNMLALNDSKTKVIHLCTKCCGQEPVAQCGLHVGGVRISPIYAVRNLRIIMDSAGTIPTHVSKLCKSALFALWKIGGIRTLLDQSTTLKLIHASKLKFMFKVMCTSYEITYHAAPTYLNDLPSIYAPPTNLCSKSTGKVMLDQPMPCNNLM